MLRIYESVLCIVRDLGPVFAQVARHDPDLARQGRRALCSVPLNVSEGAYSPGRLRRARYSTAAGSLREALAVVECAVALEYVARPNAAVLDRIDRVLATLWKLTH